MGSPPPASPAARGHDPLEEACYPTDRIGGPTLPLVARVACENAPDRPPEAPLESGSPDADSAGMDPCAVGSSRADLHLHTTFSDGTATPEETLNFLASRTPFRVVAVTDHDTIDGALRARRYVEEHPEVFAGIEVIVGEEVSTREGHVIGLFLQEWIPPGLTAARTVEEIHRQGGVAIAAHPYTNLMRWNSLVGVGDLIRSLPFDAVEVRNANFTEFRANRKAERRAGDRARLGSSDGHFLESIGRCYTSFPGATALDLRRAIHERRTVAEGSCYGVRTLARFVARRLRSGQSVLPNRRHFWRESPDHVLAIEVQESRHLETVVVTPVGSLDERALGELKSTLTRFGESGVNLVVDLARVSELRPQGITALVAGQRAAERGGAGFCLAAPSRASLRALHGSLLDQHLPWTEDLAEARRRAATLVAAG